MNIYCGYFVDGNLTYKIIVYVASINEEVAKKLFHEYKIKGFSYIDCSFHYLAKFEELDPKEIDLFVEHGEHNVVEFEKERIE